MKIALVHDYIKEYGGAERVLEALAEIFPDAPIYTAFYKEDSEAFKKFRNKKIIPSFVHYIPFFATKLHSPLRFLAPLIWGSLIRQLADYDVIISSASWYVTKGFGARGSSIKKPIEICYCHTPPRWLYGYRTSIEWQRFWPIKIYGLIVGHFMRMYDFSASQKVDYFIANSEEVRARIKKFYRREAIVIYPPVTLMADSMWHVDQKTTSQKPRATSYFFIVSRIVGGKGLDLAVETAVKMGLKLKIAGAPGGYYTEHEKLIKKANGNIEFLGFVSDEELAGLYQNAKAFLALSEDEDFGITPVEAMSVGTPVIAYNGGGYKETVIDGKTGIFFDELSVKGLIGAIKKLSNLEIKENDCLKQAQKFSKERFKKEIKEFVEKLAQEKD